MKSVREEQGEKKIWLFPPTESCKDMLSSIDCSDCKRLIKNKFLERIGFG
jgi:hypothetical protein